MNADTFPGPRELKEIVKLPLLKRESPAVATTIWEDHHKEDKRAVGAVFSPDEFNFIRSRGMQRYVAVLLILSMVVFPSL